MGLRCTLLVALALSLTPALPPALALDLAFTLTLVSTWRNNVKGCFEIVPTQYPALGQRIGVDE